jgi:enoyl-CoA hydratase/carnithine racemase
VAASLSHEITQPIASARNNARAAQNFLHKQTPDLREVEEALGYVVVDADRAGNESSKDHADFFTPQGYDKIYREGRKVLMNILDIEVPLIAAVNGPMRLHSEYVLLADIVLATPSTVFQDKPHFELSVASGDALLRLRRAGHKASFRSRLRRPALAAVRPSTPGSTLEKCDV